MKLAAERHEAIGAHEELVGVAEQMLHLEIGSELRSQVELDIPAPRFRMLDVLGDNHLSDPAVRDLLCGLHVHDVANLYRDHFDAFFQWANRAD